MTLGVHRCKCCLQLRPAWMEYDGRRFCSYPCAEAWAECIQGRHLLAAAQAKRNDERKVA